MSKTNWNSHWFQSWTSFDCFLEGKLIDYRNREENRVGRKIGRRSSHPQIIIPGCHSHQFRILARDSPNLLFFLLPITDQHVFPEFIAGVFNFFLERSWKKMRTALEQGGENHSTRMLEWQWIQIQLSSWSRFDCSKKFKKFKKKNQKNSKKISEKKKNKNSKKFWEMDCSWWFILIISSSISKRIGSDHRILVLGVSCLFFSWPLPLLLSSCTFRLPFQFELGDVPLTTRLLDVELEGKSPPQDSRFIFFWSKMKVCWRN